MKSTGIVRKVDELGRVVIPREMRKILNIKIKDPLEIHVEGNSIILNKFHEITCKSCEQKIDESDRFCKNCGTVVILGGNKDE
jgi:transcriptional pleiotropic regulator of transition state genes